MFAIVHVIVFLWLIARAPAFPLWVYADPAPAVTIETGGMTFSMCHDCGPGFALAGRGFDLTSPGYDGYVQWAIWLNLPSRLVAGVAGAIAEGPLGLYGAMWVATFVFAISSVAQWWVIGWVVGGRGRRQWEP